MRRKNLIRATTLAMLASAVAALGAGAVAAPAQASAGAWWLANSSAAPTNLKPGSKVIIYAMATDIGYEDVSGASSHVVFSDTVPAGLKVIIESGEAGVYRTLNQTYKTIFPPCTTTGRVFSCSLEGDIRPAESVRVRVEAEVEPGVELGSTLTNEFKVEGGLTPKGGAPTAQTFKKEMPVTDEAVKFGTERFELRPENKDGTPDTQAGSHPFQLTTIFNLNKTLEPYVSFGQPALLPFLPALPKDLHFILPPGMVGAVAKVPQCSGTDFVAVVNGKGNRCKPDSAIGFANATLDEPLNIGPFTQEVPIFNLTPTKGEPARFGFIAHTVPVVLTTHVRSGKDYAVEVSVHLLPESIEILNTEATFWGVPHAAEHDNARSWPCLGGGYLGEEEPCEELKDPEPPALLTMPTSCDGTPQASVHAVAWSGEEFSTTENIFNAPLKGAFENCKSLPFAPTVEVETDSHEAATPSGLTVKVKVPQESTVSGKEGELAEASIKGTTLTLPPGIQASGGASDGLLTCTGDQFGFELGGLGETLGALTENDHFNEAEIACPDAAKIGTVKIKTPLIEEELSGSVYLASKDTNPFNSPLVLYIFAEGPESKVQVKLAGEVKINQTTGQLTSTFENTPPVAFSELNLHLFDGPRASQSTPETCGNYSASATFESWADEEAEPNSTAKRTANVTSKPFEITSGPHKSACPAPGTQPFAPGFEAGTENSKAGAFSPLILNLQRPDGNQALKTLSITAPAGSAAILASVEPCPTAVATAPEPNCPESSQIGVSTAYAGLGTDHVKIPGKVYLTGPYKGAPFGVLALSDAEHIGPFNLGKIPVMSTITVNENTAVATFTSDPLPERVRGVPSQINSLRIEANRPNFTFNPTSCKPLAFTGTLTGYGPNGSSGVENVETPYHTEGCASLPFKPTIEASIESAVSRSTGTGLKITVHSGAGQANIGKTKLEFPTTIPSRLTTLQKSCRDTVFDVNPANCSPESIVGTGTAHTPVLKAALTGPIYLVSHGNAAFPDAEFVLQGEGIKLVLDGKTDIEKGITISSFEEVPDAPVESFEVSLPRSTKSAFSGYGDLCTENPVMPTKFTGQNGVVINSTTKVNVTGCGGVVPFHKESELAKNLKTCKKLAKKKQAKCIASAHKRASALAACNKVKKGKKRTACQVKARKKNPLKKS